MSSSTVEVGQTIEWGLRIYSSAGALADPGTGPVAVVTLPDGTTTASATVTRVSVGVFVATHVSTVAGLHVVRWTATGVNSGDLPFTDTALVAAPLPRLLSVDELARHLQQTIPDTLWVSAEDACDDAATLIRAHLRSDLADLAGWRLDSAKLVAKRSAARFFTNPQQRTSYSGPEGLSYQGGPVRLLTDDEKAILDGLKGDSVAVGTISMAVAPWMTPAEDDEVVA